jgi:hypothetical protein
MEHFRVNSSWVARVGGNGRPLSLRKVMKVQVNNNWTNYMRANKTVQFGALTKRDGIDDQSWSY